MAWSSLVKASFLVPDFAASIRSSATYGDSGTEPSFCRTVFLAIDTAGDQMVAFSTLPGSFFRFTFLPPRTSSAQSSDCSKNLGESNITSAIPSSRASAGFSIRFCFRGFSIITFRAFLIPIRFGSKYAPPQPGINPRNTSGSAIAGAAWFTVR